MQIRVNPITCEGHGVCAELLPELVTLDDWGLPVIEKKEVPTHLESLARKARDLCPALAFLLQ